ncbi:MAG TPA: DUF2064 domain-containing protein, partial [Stellaceae bacterium]|nr:DUF2064 domain-containing protein [Stellaceae bacterium]
MTAETGQLVIPNASAPSRVSASLARAAEGAGWRLVRLGRLSGRRLAGILRRLDPGPVVAIAAEVPMPAARAALGAAFAALVRQDLVLGPSEDGGYWLIGLARRRRMPPGLWQPLARPSGDTLA